MPKKVKLQVNKNFFFHYALTEVMVLKRFSANYYVSLKIQFLSECEM